MKLHEFYDSQKKWVKGALAVSYEANGAEATGCAVSPNAEVAQSWCVNGANKERTHWRGIAKHGYDPTP